MVQSSDINGRLRLFRYGLIVVLVITFLVSLFAPYAASSPLANELNTLAAAAGTDRVDVTVLTFLPQALVTTVLVGVVLVVIYFLYRRYLLNATRSA